MPKHEITPIPSSAQIYEWKNKFFIQVSLGAWHESPHHKDLRVLFVVNLEVMDKTMWMKKEQKVQLVLQSFFSYYWTVVYHSLHVERYGKSVWLTVLSWCLVISRNVQLITVVCVCVVGWGEVKKKNYYKLCFPRVPPWADGFSCVSSSRKIPLSVFFFLLFSSDRSSVFSNLLTLWRFCSTIMPHFLVAHFFFLFFHPVRKAPIEFKRCNPQRAVEQKPRSHTWAFQPETKTIKKKYYCFLTALVAKRCLVPVCPWCMSAYRFD